MTILQTREGRFTGGSLARLGVALTAVVALAVALIFPYSSRLLAYVMIYALAVAGWNLVSGYAGQTSFGHAAFFGLGAYGAATWTVTLGRSAWIGIAVGALVAAALAMAVGYISWRLDVRGIYFALVLFAVSELLLVLVANTPFLGGTVGLFGGIGEDSLVRLTFGDPRWFALIAGVALAAVMLGTAAMARSGFGRQLAMVRHDEVAAVAAGINTMRVKLLALGASAVVTAVAGGLYAQIQLFVQPELVLGMQTNLRIIFMGFLGGAGTLWGPLLGSTGVTALEAAALEVFGGQPGVDTMAFGLALVAAVTFLPHGLAWRRRTSVPAPGIRAAERPEAAREEQVGAGVPAQGVPSRMSPAGQRPLTQERAVVLEAVNLAKSFGGLKVVDGVSLQLFSGTIHGLIGPNGAGKTTLLNLLTGTAARDAGDVLLDGRSVAGLPPYQLARQGIVRTFQIPRPLGDISVEQIVLTAATASGRSSDPQQSTERALGVVGLGPQRHLFWRELNGSQQRRLEVARCLAQEPRVLLLDESMSGLAKDEVDSLVALVRSLPDTHPEMTILFIEHLMHVMMTLADHITVLDRGRVIASGPPDAISRDANVVNAYLGSSV